MFENLQIKRVARVNVAENNLRPHTSAHNILVILVAALASFTFGYTNNTIAGTLAQTSFAAKFFATGDVSSIIGGILGGYFGGALIGSILQAPMSSRFGRRVATAVAAVVIVISSALCAGSVNVAMFITARTLNGIGAGIIVSNTPVYMSEISPPHTRGLLVGTQGVAITTAYVISSIAALGFHYVSEPYQWRLQFVVCTGLGFLLFGSLWIIPESPRWLTEKGRFDEAWKVLERLHRSKEDSEGHLAKAEMAQIRAQIEVERTLPKGIVFILTHRSTRKRAICGIVTWFMGQSTGVLVIANLAPLLFAGLGFDTELQLGLAIIWVFACQIGTVVSISFNDRIGRVKLMVIGGYLCALILLIEAILQKEYVGTTNHAGLRATTAMYFVFIFVFGATIEGTAYTYVVEIWPTHLRSEGATIGFVSYFATTIAFNSPASLAFDTIGWKYYLIFVVLSVVLSTFMLFYFPETAGRSLEEVGEMFGDKVEVQMEDFDISKVTVEGKQEKSANIEDVDRVF